MSPRALWLLAFGVTLVTIANAAGKHWVVAAIGGVVLAVQLTYLRWWMARTTEG